MAYLVPPLVQTETNSGNHFILFEDSTTGVLVPRTDSGLIYSPLDNMVITGAFKSNITDGTAPLQITSKTLVVNLNVDLLDGKHASDFAPSSHTSSDGSSHTFIDQDVRTTASPTFNKVTADNGLSSGNATIKYNSISKTLDFIFV